MTLIARTVIPINELNVALVLPAYNEEALPEFVNEIRQSVGSRVGHLQVVVVDDASTMHLPQKQLTASVANHDLPGEVHLVRNEHNLGHGPTALRGYLLGLATSPDVVLHVDGDGQFTSDDLGKVLMASTGRDGACGVRRQRVEPWYRRGLTLVTRVLANGHPDANTPLRVYQASILKQLLDRVPSSALVPHVHFSRLEQQLDLDMAYVDVKHQPRRGSKDGGTAWGRARSAAILPNRRLLRFAFNAGVEVLVAQLRSHTRRRATSEGEWRDQLS